MACPDCFSGAIHEGTPGGVTTKLHGLDTYVAEPASGRAAQGLVVIIPDAFGWDFVNIRLLADTYAKKKDYRVYAPDFMNGNSAPLYMLDGLKAAMNPGKTWGETLKKPYHILWMLYGFASWVIPNRFSQAWPRVKPFMEKLRRNEGAHLPIGVAGFCWGGKYALTLGHNLKADGKPLVDAVFTGHPSLLALPDDVDKLTAPASFAIGDSDNQVNLEQAENIRQTIEAKAAGQKGEMRIYKGYGHGFAVRIDIKNDSPAGAAEAEDQCLAWFGKHFEQVKY
ncbi:dienelactone hydrolase family protein [Xylariaceae sp. FL0016]|nr:dienelactone hydrolase family protein [Xylariaceae sp. FL0016]